MDIIIENRAIYAIFRTNATIRPIKLLVDTGAMITVVASDLMKPEAIVKNDSKNLCGITGTEIQVKTCGTTHVAILSSKLKDNAVNIKMHLFDRKYLVNGDGYLGFDFMHQLRTMIDIANKKLVCML